MIKENRINKHTRVYEQELWDQYIVHKNKTEEIYYRNKLVELHIGLVNSVAFAVAIDKPSKIDLEDLRQEGIFGLIEGIEGFDPSLGFAFSTYCYPKIKGAIFNSLRKMYETPYLTVERRKQLKKAIHELGHYFSEEDLIKELSKSKYVATPINKQQDANLSAREKASRIIKGANNAVKINSISDMNNYEMARKKYLATECNEYPYERLQRNDLVEVIAGLIKKLKARERSVLDSHYYQKKTLKEIGKLLELTGARIDQIKVDGLQNIKYFLKSKNLDLEDFL